MPSPAIAEAVQPADPQAVALPDRFHPAVLSIASALLLWFAFPTNPWSWLAWVGLVPLLLLVRSTRAPRAIYCGSWLGSMIYWLLSIYWISVTDPDAGLAWVVMALALSCWWPGFLVLARLAVGRLGLPLMAAAPVLWVGLEYVRAHILTGFPWYYLAHSQHQVLPLIQIADITGALGISFLIVLVNAWLVDVLTVPLVRPAASGSGVRPALGQVVRAVVVVAAVGATLAYGAYRLASAQFRDGPRLALLQSNIEQQRKMAPDYDALLAVYKSLVAQALRDNERLDLIVWPETSYPYQFVARDPQLSDAGYEQQARQLDPDRGRDFWEDWGGSVSSYLHSWTDQIKVPMLVGVVTYDFHRRGFAKYNTALLFQPGLREIQRYAKIHLVPFGEYVPFLKTVPWLKVLTPYRGSYVPSLSFGREPTWFALGPYRLASAICFEDTIPQAVRRFFSGQGAAQPPDVLLNLSNDGWFRGTSEHDMHLAISVFRAVENRVPLARAVNTGMSALVDGNGRVLALKPKLTAGVLSGVVPLDDRVSLYSAWGDWLGLGCLAATALVLPAGGFRSLRTRRKA